MGGCMKIESMEEAVRLALAGVEEGYRYLYENTSQDIYNYLYMQSGRDRDKADSLIRKVYERAWEQLPKLNIPAEFPLWIRDIAENMAKEGRTMPVPPIGADLNGPGSGLVGNMNAAPRPVSRSSVSPNVGHQGGQVNMAHHSEEVQGAVSPGNGPQTGAGRGPGPQTGGSGGSGPKTGGGSGSGPSGAGHESGKRLAEQAAKKTAKRSFFSTAAGKTAVAVVTTAVISTAGVITYNKVKKDDQNTSGGTETATVSSTTEPGEEADTTSGVTPGTESADISNEAAFGKSSGTYLLSHSTVTQDGNTVERYYSYDPGQKQMTAEDSPAYLMYSAPVNPNEVIMPYYSGYYTGYHPAAFTYLSGGLKHPSDQTQFVAFHNQDTGEVIYDDLYTDQEFFSGNGIIETYDEEGRPLFSGLVTLDEEERDLGLTVLEFFQYDAGGKISAAGGLNQCFRYAFTETGDGYGIDVYTQSAGSGGESYTLNYHGNQKTLNMADKGSAPGHIDVHMAGGRVMSAEGTLYDISSGGGQFTDTFSIRFTYSDTGMTVEETRQRSGTDYDGSTVNSSYSATREYILLGTDSTAGYDTKDPSSEEQKPEEKNGTEGKELEQNETGEIQPGDMHPVDISGVPSSDLLTEFLTWFDVYSYRNSYDCKNPGASENILSSVLGLGSCINWERYPVDHSGYESSHDPEGRYAQSQTADENGVKWIMSNILHVSDGDYENMKEDYLRTHEAYLKDGYYYWRFEGYGWENATPQIKEVQTDGRYYTIRYSMLSPEGDGEYGNYTAVMELKEIDGVKYWSIYSLKSE